MATTGVTLASGNRVKHSKIRESAFGVIPTSPAFKNLRVTSSSLQPNIDTVTSQELRTDRQIPDQTTVAVKASGDLNFELSFNALDDFFEEVLQGAWSPKPTIVSTGTGMSISSTSTINVSAGGTLFVTGMIVQTSGFATAANNKTAIVVSSTSTTIVFAASTFVNDSSSQAGATVRAVGIQASSGDIAATTGGLSSTALDFTTIDTAAGDWIKIGGAAMAAQFATAADNTFVRVTTVAAHALTCDNLPTNWAADTGSGKTISIFFGDTVTNGTTFWTSTIERNYTDQATPTFEYYTGSATDKLSLSMQASQIVTGSVSMVSQNAAYQTSRASGATDIAAPTYAVLNATSHFGRIGFGGASVVGPDFVMTATVEFANNITPAMAVGSLGAVAMTDGDFNVTGTLDVYFGDISIITNLLNNAPTALNFRIGNTIGNDETYVIDFPQVKLSSAQINDVTKNRPVMQNIGYRAVLSPTYGYTAKICRFFYHE